MADEESFTDEQLLSLLKGAEERLLEKEQNSLAFGDKVESFNFPRLSTGEIAKSHVETGKHGATKLTEAATAPSTSTVGIRNVEDPVMVRKRIAETKKATAGSQWYNLPKTDLTPELKRDLQLLKMRNVLDPHRHYKKENGKMLAPEYSQVGKIIEGPTEYYSARLSNKDRKRTFVEEVLAGEQETGRFKRKYGDVQTKKTSGGKNYYKKVQAKRATSFKR